MPVFRLSPDTVYEGSFFDLMHGYLFTIAKAGKYSAINLRHKGTGEDKYDNHRSSEADLVYLRDGVPVLMVGLQVKYSTFGADYVGCASYAGAERPASLAALRNDLTDRLVAERGEEEKEPEPVNELEWKVLIRQYGKAPVIFKGSAWETSHVEKAMQTIVDILLSNEPTKGG